MALGLVLPLEELEKSMADMGKSVDSIIINLIFYKSDVTNLKKAIVESV